MLRAERKSATFRRRRRSLDERSIPKLTVRGALIKERCGIGRLLRLDFEARRVGPDPKDGSADAMLAALAIGARFREMGRTRRRRRSGKTGGGALSSMRGRFRSVARGVTGTGGAQPTSRVGRVTSNVITVLLLLIAVALLLRRFGIFHR
jgi:hypothetical protein